VLTAAPRAELRAQSAQPESVERTRSAVVMVAVLERAPQPAAPTSPQRPSQGVGFFVTPDGHVLVQQPVVAGASKIEVHLQDGRRLAAALAGQDSRTGLALVKTDASSRYPVLKFAATDAAVGDRVFVVSVDGSTVTAAEAGVSRLAPEFIELEVPVRKGTAGGPVVDAAGEVVGVVLAHRRSPDGVLTSASLAIPGWQAARVADELRMTGKVERGWLGLSMANFDVDAKDIRSTFGLPDPAGAARGSAVIKMLEENGPAYQAGLRAGDVILKLDGVPVKDAGDFIRRLGDVPPGATVSLVILRNGKEQPVSLARRGRQGN
jgi:serine protease Do